MKKWCLILVLIGLLSLGLGGSALADEEVELTDGRRVLLKSDGTWREITKQKSKAAQEVIARYSGNGGRNTRPFKVTGPWEIQWQAKGELFQIFLYTADGSVAGVPANQQGPGPGSSYHPRPGSYYLQVNAMGGWRLKIVSVD